MADTLLLTDDRDIDITGGKATIIDGEEAFRQNVLTNLHLYLEEWFGDTSIGVPWLQDIFEKGISPDQVNSIIKAAILDVPGADKLNSYIFDFDEGRREYTITFNVAFREQNLEFEDISLVI